jgi:hypothetical protein
VMARAGGGGRFLCLKAVGDGDPQRSFGGGG